MRAYVTVFLRAFSIVTLTAFNVVNIGREQWLLAFLTGCGISGVWWFNAHTAAHNKVPGAWVAYMLGAGCGTVCGMGLGLWMGGRS